MSNTSNRTLISVKSVESFETIFKRYYPLVYQLAYRCTGQRDEADDIAQEVFLRYYRKPPQTTYDGEQRAWLCRVATNLGLNALRAQQRRHSREEKASDVHWQPASQDTDQLNPEQQVIANEQAAFLRSILSELPERQQTYILLRSVGLSYAEIAEATGISPASVGSLLARAEREFRRRYHERVATIPAE